MGTHVLNEDNVSESYIGDATHPYASCENGFEYKVMPLQFNLQQSAGKNRKSNPNILAYHIGNHVEGICMYDKKKHHGYITQIYGKDTPEYHKPEIVYILDADTNEVLPLDSDTLKQYQSKQKWF